MTKWTMASAYANLVAQGNYARISDIRKHFYQTPESARVPEGRTVQLPCVPPDADPKADVSEERASAFPIHDLETLEVA